MSESRWFLVLAPDGAARTVAKHASQAFSTLLGRDRCKEFDCLNYRRAFEQYLKIPDPTLVVDLLNQSLIISCLDFGATHCFVSSLSPVTLFTLQLLRRQGIITVHWYYEDFLKATYWKSVLEGYDHFFAVQHAEVEAECERHPTGYHFLPTATGCGGLPYSPLERKYDVVFIGLPSSYRVAVLESLARQNVSLAIAGSNWNSYHGILEKMIITSIWVEEPTAFSLMQQSKIGINLSFDNPAGRDGLQISPRAFDCLAAGCLLITEENPLLDESLPQGSCFKFHTVDEAVALTTNIIANYPKFAVRVEQNRMLVLNDHQYLNRVETILRRCS